MYQMSTHVMNLKRKVEQYKTVLANTRSYRDVWNESLKEEIIDELKKNAKEIELECEVDCKADLENLQAVVLSLGQVKSGMFESINETLKRHLVKHNGSLVYQQLFNGKIIVLINYPFIEGYGQPQPPKTIGIYRPEELTSPFFVRHLEEFITDITHWEDFDDDQPASNANKIGFQLNFGSDIDSDAA